jgi:hypothetical protein
MEYCECVPEVEGEVNEWGIRTRHIYREQVWIGKIRIKG